MVRVPVDLSESRLQQAYDRLLSDRTEQLRSFHGSETAEQVAEELSGASREEQLERVLAWSVDEFELESNNE